MDKWVSRFYFVGGGDLKEFQYCIRIVLNPPPRNYGNYWQPSESPMVFPIPKYTRYIIWAFLNTIRQNPVSYKEHYDS